MYHDLTLSLWLIPDGLLLVRSAVYRSVYLSCDGVAHLNYQTYKLTTRLIAPNCELVCLLYYRSATTQQYGKAREVSSQAFEAGSLPQSQLLITFYF